jgi:hypothetical protein
MSQMQTTPESPAEATQQPSSPPPPSAPPAPEPAPVVAPTPPGRVRRFFGFFWCGHAVAAARAEISAKSRARVKLEQHAQAAAELGDRTLRPVDPLRAGSGDLLASLLYAESVRATLAALGSSLDRFDSEPELRAELERLLPERVEWPRLRQLVEQSSRLDELGSEPTVQSREARALAAVAHALIARARAPERSAHRALVQRFVLFGSSVLVFSLLVIFGIQLGIRMSLGPDLSVGKAWRASSSYAGFSPATGECDGRKTKIFFHTAEEVQPWVEYDLASPTTIRRVDVRNRTDCCPDRAFPLALEVSRDGQQWQELARRDTQSYKWTIKLAPTEARYVRLKALKRTFLHLEAIEIR